MLSDGINHQSVLGIAQFLIGFQEKWPVKSQPKGLKTSFLSVTKEFLASTMNVTYSLFLLAPSPDRYFPWEIRLEWTHSFYILLAGPHTLSGDVISQIVDLILVEFILNRF